MDLFVRFGAAVRRLRMHAGYSQESLADLVGMHRNYIGTVERGETNISLENMHPIARGLRISLSALFAEVEGTDAGDDRPAPTSVAPTRGSGADNRAALLRPALDRMAEARQALEDAVHQLQYLDAGGDDAGVTRSRPRRRKNR